MFGANTSGHTIVWTSVAAIFLGISAWWWQDWRRKKMLNAIPKQWRAVGEVQELTLYPLKSGRGIQVTEGECTITGLRMKNEDSFELADRTFMIFNEKDGSFLTARLHPLLVLITVSVGMNGKVTFESPVTHGAPKLEIDIPDKKSQRKICSMWFGEKVDALDCGDDAAAWFSKYITGKEKTHRLGYYPGRNNSMIKRTVEKQPWTKVKKYFTKIRNEDYGIYSDLASFMILGANSVAELNTRLDHPVTAAHFRPNIIVQGSDPYDEDSWDWVKIGDSVVFRSVKPCTRCVMTTINPDTGKMDNVSREPLKTLQKYRKLTDPGAVAVEGNSPVMGLYMGMHVPGAIKVGDKVYVNVENDN